MTSNEPGARVLVLAEHRHQELSPTTARLITAAQTFDLPVDLLVAGSNCRIVAEQAIYYFGVSRIYLADQPELLSRQAEVLSACLLPLLQDSHDILLVASNSAGRELVPRLAACLNVSPLSDVVQIKAFDRFIRPIHAGAALIEVKLSARKKLMTVRPSGFEHTGLHADQQALAKIQSCPAFSPTPHPRQIGEEFFWDQPALEDANIVIGLGRGVLGRGVIAEENFALVDRLAEHLGAVIGGSRPAIDAGLVPGNELIGQSGKTIAPNLYIALGISGAVQHLAGIRDAKTIIAVNKDPDAPIFKIADYGLIGDLRDILPELEKALF